MTIRNLHDQLKQRLRVRAATHGRSMEDEVRDILRTVLAAQPSTPSLIEAIRAFLIRTMQQNKIWLVGSEHDLRA